MCDFCTKFDHLGDREIKEEVVNLGVLGQVSVRVIAVSDEACEDIDGESVMKLDIYMEVKNAEGYTAAEKEIFVPFKYCPQCGRKI